MQTEADVHNAERCEKTWKQIRIVGLASPVSANEHFDFAKANNPKAVRRSGSQCRLLDRNPIWTAHHAINRRGTKPVRRDGAGSMMWDAIELARRLISPTRDCADSE